MLWIANKTGTPRNVLPPARAGGRITDVDAAGFDQLTRTPLFLESASRNLAAGPIELDAYAVAAIQYRD